MKSHLLSFMLSSNMRIKYGSAYCDNVFAYGRGTGTRTRIDRLKADYSSL